MRNKKFAPPSSQSLRPDAHRIAVIENGLEFIERSIGQLWLDHDQGHLKHSVIGFYNGVELLIKARLMHEHWALVVSDTNKANKEDFLKGEFTSVGLDEAIKRIETILGEDVPQKAKDAFAAIRKHRNKLVHFAMTDVDDEKTRVLIVTEQCRAWFHLRRLLADQWGAIFPDELTLRISQINAVMKQHRSHLDTVYAEIRPDLLAEERKGAVLARCRICEHDAHVVVAKGPEETACKVCTSRETFLRHTCEACVEDFLAEPVAGSQQCPHCSAPMSHTDIADAYTDEGAMSPHDGLIDDASYGYCVDCSTLESVGTVAGRFFCFSCHTWHETMGHCEWCSSKTTGDVEDTYWNGCEQCEGRAAQG